MTTGTNNEITIVIRADGSAAVANLDQVSAAVGGLNQATGQATPALGETAKGLLSVQQSALQTGQAIVINVVSPLQQVPAAAKKAKNEIDWFKKMLDEAKNAAKGLGDTTETMGKKVSSGSKNAEKDVAGLGSSFRGLATEINQSLELANKVARIGGAVLNAAESAAKLEETRDSFQRYAQSQGQSAEAILSKMKVMSGGTITEMQLMQTASKAMTLGVAKDAQTIGDLLLIARNKGRLFGMDTAQAFDDLVTGIGRNSPLILDNLGIRIPQALKDATQGMSDLDAATMLTSATLKEGMKEIEAMGGVVNSAADSFRQMNVMVQDMKDGIGDQLIPVVLDLAESLKPVASLMLQVIEGWAKIALLTTTGIGGVGTALGHATAGTLDSKTYLNPPRLDEMPDPISKARHSIDWYESLLKHPTYSSSDDARLIQTLLDRQKKILEKLYSEGKRERERLFDEDYKSFMDSLFFGQLNRKPPTLAEEEKAKKVQARESQANASKAFSQTSEDLNAIAAEVDTLDDMMKDLFDEAATGADKLADQLEKDLEPLLKWTAAFEHMKTSVKNWALGDTLKNWMSGETSYNPGEAFDNMGLLWKITGIKPWEGGSKADVEKTLRGTVEEPISRVFHDAVKKAFDRDGSDIWAAVREGLSSAVSSAMADMVTNVVLGQSGLVSRIINQGGGSGSNLMQTALSTATGGSNGGGGTGFSIFKPITYSKNAGALAGNLNWTNIGTNLLIGTAVNRLLGAGGLFGDRVVHGQEWIDQAAEINTQVDQAKALRDALYKEIGVSEATRQALKEATFSYAGAYPTYSGNGWSSKKTTTYLPYGRDEAGAAIQRIKGLQKVAEGEQGWMNYQIADAGRYGGVRPLEIALTNIEALAKRVKETQFSNLKVADLNPYVFSEAEQADIITKHMEAKSALATAVGTARNTVGQTLFSTPDLFSAYAGTGLDNLMGITMGTRDVPADDDMIRLLLPGLKAAGLNAFETEKSALEAGSDPEKLLAVMETKKSGLERAIEAYEKIWRDAEQEALDASLSIEEQRAAFDRFQEAQQALLDAKYQSLQIDQEMERLEQEKKQNRQDDLLSSIFTSIAEIKETGGQTTIIPIGLDAAGNGRIEEVLQLIEGTNPETARLIRDALNATRIPTLVPRA